jgi:hypothetical protein
MAEIIPVQRNGTGWVLSEGWLTHNFLNLPFEMPYWIMLPSATEATNLLVPVAASVSHVAFGGIRLEPTWSILGHAAGVAAGLAVTSARVRYQVPHQQQQNRQVGGEEAFSSAGVSVQDVSIAALQAALINQGQYIYATTLPPEAPKVACR